MASNRIQFQHGMSLPEFVRCFGSEAQCAEAVKAARWPDGFQCPRCGLADHYVVGHGARKLFQCTGCRHQTSLTAGSLMEHTKLWTEKLEGHGGGAQGAAVGLLVATFVDVATDGFIIGAGFAAGGVICCRKGRGRSRSQAGRWCFAKYHEIKGHRFALP